MAALETSTFIDLLTCASSAPGLHHRSLAIGLLARELACRFRISEFDVRPHFSDRIGGMTDGHFAYVHLRALGLSIDDVPASPDPTRYLSPPFYVPVIGGGSLEAGRYLPYGPAALPPAGFSYSWCFPEERAPAELHSACIHHVNSAADLLFASVTAAMGVPAWEAARATWEAYFV